MKSLRFIASGLILALCSAGAAWELGSAESTEPTLSILSLETKALETLNALELTKPQLKALEQLAAGAADTRDCEPGKGPAALRTALAKLGDAIVQGADDDQIEDLQDDVSELRDGDDVDLDDSLELTALARKHAPGALKLLDAGQLASYISDNADDITDPAKELCDALEQLRTADKDGFVELRNEMADDIALALGGLDTEKDTKVSAQVTAWLNKVRAMSPGEFQSKRTALQQEAKALVGEIDSFTVVRNYLLRDMAELLANPRLSAAIERRLAAMKG